MGSALAILKTLGGFLSGIPAILGNPTALIIIALAYTGGYWRGDARSDAQHRAKDLKAQLDAAKIDKASLERAASAAKQQAEDARAIASRNATILEEIKSHAAKSGPCTLSAADARRLLSIR